MERGWTSLEPFLPLRHLRGSVMTLPGPLWTFKQQLPHIYDNLQFKETPHRQVMSGVGSWAATLSVLLKWMAEVSHVGQKAESE